MISNLVKACGEPFAQNNEKVYLTFTTACWSNMVINIKYIFTVYNTTIHFSLLCPNNDRGQRVISEYCDNKSKKLSQAQFSFYINDDELVLNSFVLFFSVMGFGPVLLKIQKRILVSMN